jgi:hypothetical protein
MLGSLKIFSAGTFLWHLNPLWLLHHRAHVAHQTQWAIGTALCEEGLSLELWVSSTTVK